MSFQLTERVIKLLCGEASYENGAACYQEGRVTMTKADPDASVYEATVSGSSRYAVNVHIDSNGDVDAGCTCPSFYASDDYCMHIAAVLLGIHELQHDGRSPVRSYTSMLYPESDSAQIEPKFPISSVQASTELSGDAALTNSLLKLFDDQPLPPSRTRSLFETRTPLEAEFICKPVPYGYRNHMFGIEMKIGVKRLYIVQRIRDFLERIDRSEEFVFTGHFSYNPELHCFQKEDDAVIRQLIQIVHSERMLRETLKPYSVHASSLSGDRVLLIPPSAWEALLPLLTAAPSVKLEQGSRTFDGMQLSEESLPLHFEFDEAQGGNYQLAVKGLDQITIMDMYGVVLHDGKLLRLQASECKRLAELKQMLEGAREPMLPITSEQMEPFMEKVVPRLMKLGNIRITQAVSERMLQTPLKAKLYLDRVKDRLLAGLEFQYGDIIINPLEERSRKRGEGRILMRDGDQERRILELMEQGLFAKTEGGYFLDDEDAEYDFLYYVLPQLEKLVQVYATSAVKARLYAGHAPPAVKVNVDERTDWLEIRFDLEGIRESDIREVLKSLEEKRRYYRLPGGALMPLESEAFQEIVSFMNEIGIRTEDLRGTGIRLPAFRALRLLDSQRQGGQGRAVKLGRSLRRLLENMRNPDNLDFPVPDGLEPVLRDYQKYGFHWLKTLAHYGFGGILADEMGLGKTLQSIAFIVSELSEIRMQALPVLIVSPASLMYNWRNELNKFAPEVRAVIADGSKTERARVLKAPSRADVILTSYPLLRRDMELYAGQMFHTLILDEAQAFKNHATQTAQAVKLLQARYRFALTGTPVENSLEDLWSIFGAAFPELFPGKREFNDLTREQIIKRVRPFLLRRLKSDVLQELPEKIESLQASELLPEQKKLYAAYLAKLRQETLKHLDEEGFQKNRIKILAGLTRLRQLCCHPALFVDGYDGSSAKFEQLMEIVEECHSAGKRMLVFSQFTEMLGFIGRELGYQGVPYFYLDGSTPASERVELCSRFNEGERELFLISLKAGGTGLNLTGADTVILYDLWWNPAVEQQAVDRAHRIGQKNVVQVIRLVAQGTVEDKMYELQQKKKNLIEEVLQPGQETLSTLTEQDIRQILMLE